MEDVTELYVLWILSLLSFDFLALLQTAVRFKLPRMWTVPDRLSCHLSVLVNSVYQRA